MIWRAHVDEFVDEEEAAFEHLLVEKHAALGLRGHDEQNRKEVGGEPRPGRVANVMKEPSMNDSI